MTPHLRFPEFNQPWQQVKLTDLATRGEYGMNAAAKKFDGSNLYVRITDIDEDSRQLLRGSRASPSGGLEDKYLLRPNDILLARTGASVGKSYIHSENGLDSYFAGFLIRFRVNQAYPYFVYLHTLQESYRNWVKTVSARSGQPGINAEEYGNFKFYIPEVLEQQKISDFLTEVDKKITKLEQKVEKLEAYKKGVMQKIFSQEIRFRDEDGDEYPEWKAVPFNELFERVSRKNASNNLNVLTISSEQGLVNQLDYYNHSYASKDLTGYTLIERGDFAYNKSYSKGYPMGAIKLLSDYDNGVVSPLYICFRAKSNASINYFLHYFESGQFNRQLAKIAQEGARNHGLLNISVTELFNDTIIDTPSLKEQQAIASFLVALDAVVASEKLKLSKVKDFKKSLLQRMFV